MVELWSEPVKLRYSNSRCSLAYLFTIVFYIVVILFPFYLGFSTHSFWKKHETLYIQPTVTFENKFILMLEGRAGTQISWSSFPAYNGLLSPTSGRPVQISASSRDDNRDGIPDVYTISASVSLNPGEEINKASMYLFFRTEVCRQFDPDVVTSCFAFLDFIRTNPVAIFFFFVFHFYSSTTSFVWTCPVRCLLSPRVLFQVSRLRRSGTFFFIQMLQSLREEFVQFTQNLLF